MCGLGVYPRGGSKADIDALGGRFIRRSRNVFNEGIGSPHIAAAGLLVLDIGLTPHTG